MPPARSSSIHSLLNPLPSANPPSNQSPTRSESSFSSPPNRSTNIMDMDIDGPVQNIGVGMFGGGRRPGTSVNGMGGGGINRGGFQYPMIAEGDEELEDEESQPQTHQQQQRFSNPPRPPSRTPTVQGQYQYHHSTSSSNPSGNPFELPSRIIYSPTGSLTAPPPPRPSNPSNPQQPLSPTSPLSPNNPGRRTSTSSFATPQSPRLIRLQGADDCIFPDETPVNYMARFLAIKISELVADLIGPGGLESGGFNWETGELPNGQGVLEIEGKLGTIIDKTTSSRLRLPVVTETVLASDDPTFSSTIRFDSQIPFQDHSNLYCHLSRAADLGRSDRRPKSAEYLRSWERWGYRHVYTEDEFWSLPSEGRGREGGKLRVSKDSRGNIIPGSMIEKRKLCDWNVYCPQREFDWRLSVSLEKKLASFPPNAVPQSDRRRKKNRVSYIHQSNQIDLTEVQTGDQPPHYEVEVEMIQNGFFIDNCYAWLRNKKDNGYLSLVTFFMNNIHALQNRTFALNRHPETERLMLHHIESERAKEEERRRVGR